MNPTRNHHARPGAGGLAALAALVLILPSAVAHAQGDATPARQVVRVVNDASGSRLQVDGRDFMVYGMNWGYIPIGQNYTYDLWHQPDAFIEEVLAREMPLLRNMGVNAIRQYEGIPPRWVAYIYEHWGIYTVVNPLIGRYGYTFDGVWTPSVDYSNPHMRAVLKADVEALVDRFRDTPGMLMWLIGNENNYGLSWSSFEIEALPSGEREAARATYLYSLFEEIIKAIKAKDDRPVAICNGDLQYIDIIARECPDLDIMGSNVYRGISARDFFQVVKDKLGVPAMFTEFGSDAWNAREMREDQLMQARYLLGNWEEIYEQSSGKGRVGNAIGGFIFQWADGWWKFEQDSRLDIHDTNASWPNGGYSDYVEGDNNMNEEWWGICAKGFPDSRGLFEVYPRAAYYVLKHAFTLAPYAPTTDLAAIRAHFAAIDPVVGKLEARADRAALVADALDRVHLKGLRLEFETYDTGGERVTTPDASNPGTGSPAFKGFDRMESFYADFEAKPADNVTGTLSLNVLGNVPRNRIDEIFYESRGIPQNVVKIVGPPDAPTGIESLELKDIERVKVYRAGMTWDDRWFLLDGFYRTGHFHWGYEGDFFGLYREANYGENIDIYNGNAPNGFEMTGKRFLNGLKVAYGPELWWGANPAIMMKYRRGLGPVTATTVYQADLTQLRSYTSSAAVPLPPTHKVTLALETHYGFFGLQVGGIWSGQNKVGETFQVARGTPGNYQVFQDKVRDIDALGVKAELKMEQGRWHWYAQGAAMGVVADGGPTAVQNFTGWELKDSGSGNQRNFMTGLAVDWGNFQFGPNVLWQKPMVGPMPAGVPSPGRLRDVLDDPFAVRANREMSGQEIMIAYDPTPATWMWQWDNDAREDAALAASLGFVHRHFPTGQDAAIGILANGTPFAFPGSTPPRDLWEVHARAVSAPRTNLRIVAHAFTGTAEPNGDSQRLVGGKGARRYGGDARIAWGQVIFETFAKVNDFGPYDYHRDFNLTFPLQLMGDLSYGLGTPQWFGFPQTRVGVRGLWRSLDQYSPRFNPAGTVDANGIPVFDPSVAWPEGNEWEVRTYLHFAL